MLLKFTSRYTSRENLQQQLAKMQKTIVKLKNEKLRAVESKLQNKRQLEEFAFNILRRIFTPGQIQMIVHPEKKRVVWSSEDIASAISLRCVSPKAYRYLRNVMELPLPALSTLRRWASSISVDEGILTSVLQCMQAKSKGMQIKEKLVSLTFDEIYLSNRIAIDRKMQQVVGPHKTCQCVMVRSLFSNWKQPVCYYYDQSMTKSILYDIIARLHAVDYIVVAVTSDMGPDNMALWHELKIGVPPNKSFFEHPSNASLRVFVFADTPHLLKLIRNHFLDNGFKINEQLIHKKCIEKLLSINADDLKIAFNISQYHLDVKGSERQKVLPAAQLLSNKTLQFNGVGRKDIWEI